MGDKPPDPPFASTLAHHASDPFRLMVESVRDYAIYMLDPGGHVASWNPGAQLMTGYVAEEIIGKHFSCFYTPADVERNHPQAELKRALGDGRYEEEGLRVRKDGSTYWAIVTITTLRDHFGQHVGFAKVVRDISSRKESEYALLASEDRYRRLVEMMPDAVFVNTGGTIAFCNAAFVRLVGAAHSDEMIGTSALDIFAEQYHDIIRARIEAVKRGESVPPLEEELVRRDGSRVPVEVLASLVRYGEREGVMVCLHDLTARRQAEETAFTMAALIEGTDDAIIGIDLDGTVMGWNPAAERLYGYSAEEMVGQPITVIIPPQRREEFQSVLEKAREGERVPPLETVRRRKDGKLLDVSVTISPVRNRLGEVVSASSIAQDITEKKRLQEQFRQSQKMEAIGRLAGGVAHDFNNLLTVISGNSELLMMSVPVTDEARSMIAEIQNAGERAASLTRQLLTFSRKQLLEPKVLDLNAIVADSEKMLVRLLGEDIELKTKLAPELGHVQADAGQLEQVILNLSLNARDAMAVGGKLTIETANVELDESYCRTHSGVNPGPYILLAVSDTGAGMDEATKSQVFEPFFTTKELGMGTGLGLAMVYGFITTCRGHIDVYSEPGFGTTFKVYLPQVSRDLSEAPVSRGIVMPKGDETVLLVEDAEGVRRIALHTLQACGYRVLEASGGHEAIRLAEAHDGPIHLLVSDVVMPGMGGRAVAEQLATIKPGAQVLFMSGYTDDAVVRHGVLAAEMHFLQKPFTASALAQKVREVLDGGAG